MRILIHRCSTTSSAPAPPPQAVGLLSPRGAQPWRAPGTPLAPHPLPARPLSSLVRQRRGARNNLSQLSGNGRLPLPARKSRRARRGVSSQHGARAASTASARSSPNHFGAHVHLVRPPSTRACLRAPDGACAAASHGLPLPPASSLPPHPLPHPLPPLSCLLLPPSPCPLHPQHNTATQSVATPGHPFPPPPCPPPPHPHPPPHTHLLYDSVSELSISPALLVEFSMADMREACSLQLFSSIALCSACGRACARACVRACVPGYVGERGALCGYSVSRSTACTRGTAKACQGSKFNRAGMHACTPAHGTVHAHTVPLSVGPTTALHHWKLERVLHMNSNMNSSVFCANAFKYTSAEHV